MPVMPRPKAAQKIAKAILKNYDVDNRDRSVSDIPGMSQEKQAANMARFTPRTAGYVR